MIIPDMTVPHMEATRGMARLRHVSASHTPFRCGLALILAGLLHALLASAASAQESAKAGGARAEEAKAEEAMAQIAPPVATAPLTSAGSLHMAGPKEKVVLSISQPDVRITSSFTGAELVLFGVAEKADEKDPDPDVVMTVRGPKASFVTWRKSQVLGLWVNTDSRSFVEAPSFLSVQSSRPLEEMAAPAQLRNEQLGLVRNILLQRIGPDYADVVPTDPFRTAFLRIQESEQFYQEDEHGVRFIAPGVFRAELQIPGRAPLGQYEVEVKVLRDGHVIARTTNHFHVQRSGFEQELATFAQNDGLFYGIVVAIGSLFVGFIGSIVFRKE
ncbi:MAG: TIGR02186 family protein [Xanthobacter sp.]